MKGQLEFMELIIMVVGIIILVMLSYNMYTMKIQEVGTVLVEHHQSRIIRNVCEDLPNLMLPETNRTLGQILADVIQSNDTIKDYGKGTFLLDTVSILNETLNKYLGEGRWKIDLPTGDTIGYVPESEYRTCVIFQPLPNPGKYVNIVIKYW